MKKLILPTILLCLSFTLKAQVREYFPLDTINFEYNTMEIVIDTTQANNIWQVGLPSKTFFNQAYTQPFAILTDTSNNYPINDISSFYIMYDTAIACGTYISFMQKFDTDTLQDYCAFEYSIDTGETWFAAKDTFLNINWGCQFFWECPGNNSNAIGYLLRNTGKISGNSYEWIESIYHFQWYIPINKTDSEWPPMMLFRFKFTSDDTQNNKDGWMIDRIILGGFDCWGNIDEKNGLFNKKIAVHPNPAQSIVTVKNLSKTSLKKIIIYDLSGKEIVAIGVNSLCTELQTNNIGKGAFIWKTIFEDNTSESGKLVIVE